MESFDFKITEAKWQKFWDESAAFKVDDNSAKEKFYCLSQFPYPSGAGLHMGHVSIYTYADVLSRFKRHQGFEVLSPMGWDAFGLPTENHAIKAGIHPTIITKNNTDTFRRQLKDMGFAFDWSREINSSDPSYYKWTQWIWQQLHKAGLTYKAKMAVNWCDSCKVVVANEEVVGKGIHERCGCNVRRIERAQWMFAITKYAQKLLDGLDQLSWPESSKKAQRDWIGRSEGARVFFAVDGFSESIEVYTTRPDTLFGATYMVLAPEHPLVGKITTAQQKEQVEAYIKLASAKSDFDRSELAKEKTGVFTGAMAINPVDGRKIPVWIADYVLISYGTGAIMAVPAHDTRDFEFAKVFELPVIEVLSADDKPSATPLAEAFTGDGVLVHSSNAEINLDGKRKAEAIRTIITWLEEKELGRGCVNFKLRDWVFARQRYWGEPFPLAYDEAGQVELLPEDQLPLELPQVESYQPTDTGESPLGAVAAWKSYQDDKGRMMTRETDTMPNWAGSCWYYLRFMDPHNDQCFADMARQKRWGKVDVYIGGTEHLNLHDLYSRFWHLALYDLGLVAEAEPYEKLLHQGMVLGPDGSKMSKSAGNVVNPDEVISRYGADVLRLNLCFMGPVESDKPWSNDGLEAMKRFVRRLLRIYEEKDRWTDDLGDRSLQSLVHRTIKVVTQDMARYRFNTAIARLMECLNGLQKAEKTPSWALEVMTIMLSPIAPHFCEEMWERLGHQPSISAVAWPEWDEALCVEESVEIVVQEKGKIRLRMNIPSGLDEKAQEEHVLQSEEVKAILIGKKLLKIINVPGRLVNLITQG